MAGIYARYPGNFGGGSVVTSLNSLTGNINLLAGSGISITPTGNNLTIAATGGSGTVTSVALSAPSSIFSVSGSPVTTSGTLTLTLANAAANTVWAGPTSGGPGTPLYRALVAGDIPALPYASNSFTIIQTDTGTFPTASSPTDTLTLHNSDGTVSIAGNSGTKTVTINTVGLQPSGNYITALTGDVTATGPGSVAATLATVNSNVGTFGTASAVGTFTVNGKGLITVASSTSIQIAESQVTNLVSDLAGKQPVGNYITALTGDVTATGPGSVAATLATVNSNVGTFLYPQITVNGKGLITAASTPTQSANRVFSGPTSGAAAIPTFRALVNADLPTTTVVNKSSNYTVVSTDSNTYFTLDTSGAAFTLTLPAPTSGFRIKFVDSTGSFTANNLTLAPNGAEKISGLAASRLFQTNWGGWEVFSNGTDWFVI